MYTWRIAHPEEFKEVCELYRSSGLHNGEALDIQRRISAPILIKHLITFRDSSDALVGFVTFAYADDVAERFIPMQGISARDWRSGDNFWCVDFIVKPGEDGYRMMRGITKALGIKKVKYFRDKHGNVREMRA